MEMGGGCSVRVVLRLLDRNRAAYCREEMKKHGFGEGIVGMGFILKDV